MNALLKFVSKNDIIINYANQTLKKISKFEIKWLKLSSGLSGDVSMRAQAPLVDMTGGITKKKG